MGKLPKHEIALGGAHHVQYRVKEGYKWYLNLNDKVKWVKLTWNSINVPKHCFIAWVLMKNRIPVRSRLARFSDITPQCQICQQEEETQDHLFFHCTKIREMWREIWHWLNVYPKHNGNEWVQWLQNIKAPKYQKGIIYAAFTTTVYHIWEARNHWIFKAKTVDVRWIVKSVKEEVTQRPSCRATNNSRYYSYIDGLLGMNRQQE